MVKIIGIFTIVLVYYCEINAELDNLQYRKSPTADVRRVFLEKELTGNKSGEAQLHTKLTTGFREDIKDQQDQHKQYVLRNGEARYNDLEHHAVKKRRFKGNDKDDEYNQTDKHDNKRKKPKKKKRHRHHSRSKMNKNRTSTRNKKTKRYKNNTKRNDMEENNEENNKKHHYHSRSKMHENFHHNSTRNNKTKRYKNEDRNRHKDKKLNKEKNHSGKRNRDKNHSKYSKHLKNKRVSHKRAKDHINKKKQGKDKRKDKQREKSMDRNKHATKVRPTKTSKIDMMSPANKNYRKHNKTQKLNKSKDKQRDKNMDKHATKATKAMKIPKMDMMSPANKNYDKHNKTQKLNKSKDKQREKNMDHNKNATTGGPMGIWKMGMMSPTNKNYDKHNKTQKLNKSKDKQREENMDRNKNATTGGPMGIWKMGMMSPTNKNHKINNKLEPNKSKEKQKEKSKHIIDTSKTAMGITGLGAAGVAALVGKSLALESIKEPKLQSAKALTTTTTPKPPPEPVQEQEVVKLVKRERSNLRAREKIRVTKMIPFSLNKQEDEGKENLREKSERSGSSAGSPPSNLSPYAITAQMELLMKEFPNVNATITKVGRTVEYNDIILVSITAKKHDETNFRAKKSKYVDDVPEKKIIFIVHGLTVMGLKDMTSLVKSSELKLLLSYYFKHLDKFDFFLMPLANPDGYAASLSSDHTIWNKNVSPQSVCPGVFVDRNFDVAWNHTKELSSCSQLYPGASSFSEEESKVVRDIFHRFNHKILAYIHVHAGTFDDKAFKGDAILYPPGYIETQSDDDRYIDLKADVDEAMNNASFRVMSATVDTLSNWYGVVSGTSVDYAATVFGISYAMEFVMQLYDSETLNNNALTEIWSRLIDVSFNLMWKRQQGGSDDGDARRFRYLFNISQHFHNDS